MAGEEIFAIIAPGGALISVAIVVYSGFKTITKFAAKHYVSAAAYFVRLALGTLVAYAFIQLTIITLN